VESKKEDGKHRRHQLNLDPIVFVEIAFGFFNLTTVLLALEIGNWLIAVYAAIFARGLFIGSGITIAKLLTSLHFIV